MRALSFSAVHDAVFLAADRLQDVIEVKAEQRQPGRPRRPASYWAVWAKRYVDACVESDKPIQHLAERFGHGDDQVRDIIHQCRVRKFLTKVGRGRSGGRLTDLAVETLASLGEAEAET